MLNENSMLLNEIKEQTLNKKNNSRKNILSKALVLASSSIVSLPTSILCGFAALDNNSGNLANLNSLDAISNLLSEASRSQLMLGAVSFLVSEIVLASLNTKYLRGSTKTVVDLLKKDLNYIKKKLLRENITHEEKVSLIENGLFIWCFVTSLIFAELGKETLSFLGNAGQDIGFSLNLLVYFATRFAGARTFFQHFIDPKAVTALSMGESNPQHTVRKKLIDASGYLLALGSILPVVLNFVPASVQGLQNLLHYNLGADKFYHNPPSMIIGISASLPTAFFYCVTIKDLPKHLATTVAIGSEKIQSRQFKTASVLLSLTLLTLFASTFTSVGFRLVGNSNLENGYLSYVNKPLGRALSEGLFLSVLFMFWSHLQHLVNDASPIYENKRTVNPSITSYSTNRFHLFSDKSPIQSYDEDKKILSDDSMSNINSNV